MSFSNNDLKTVGRVSSFMLGLSKRFHDTERGKRAFENIPFGDMAYGQALTEWYKVGCPKNSWFSYAEEQVECPALMEFRKEISKEFGLRILTGDESKIEEIKNRRVLTTKVHDWGLN